MKKIHIGYSNAVTFDELVRLLDVDPTHPDGTSRFRRAFLSGYIRPGDFEIYSREDAGGDLTREVITLLMPFEPGDLRLFDEDLSEATVVFYVRDEKEWLTDAALGLTITDTIEIDEFDYE